MDEFNEIIRKLASEEAQRLIENDPEEYFIEEADYGYYNNGVGMACYGKEKIYDEDRAYEDAIEAIAIDVANDGDYFRVLEMEKVKEALAKHIRTL